MNSFCCYIKKELFKKFRNELDVFVSKKKLLYFTFTRALTSYHFFDEPLLMSHFPYFRLLEKYSNYNFLVLVIKK